MMYQIVRITDKKGVVKTGPEEAKNLGCVGEAKMDDGCVLVHCRYDHHGQPCDRFIHTSMVKEWKKDKATGQIVVETLNSIYQLDPVHMD